MKEFDTGKGILKYKEYSVLELVRIQSKLARAVSSESGDLLVDDYAVSLVEIMKDRFDFSGVEGVSSFDEAKEDMECVEQMIKISLEVLEKIGEVYKKKTSLRTHTMSTQDV